MPRLQYDTAESHRLLTAAEAAEQDAPELAALYTELATAGLDFDACTPDEVVREQLGMPPLDGPADGGAGDDEHGQQDGGKHPRVA